MRRGPALSLAMLLALAASAQAQDDAPLSPRNANYEIDVRLDEAKRMLEGRQTLTWRNLHEQPTSELWFHLYWNAWRNDRSSWMIANQLRRRSTRKRIREQDWGWIEVDEIRLVQPPPPFADVADPVAETPSAPQILPSRYASPDDGNPQDRTVLVVDLPRPVEPGQEVRVELRWRAKIPRTFARTGFRGDYYFIAHWFPKLGVYEADGWNCHQYHAVTEYYSDYGVYRVSINLPERFIVGATGRETARVQQENGTVTRTFEQADVHAFTWTASPDFEVRESRFEEPGLPPVDMRLLVQPEHLGQAERHFEATRAALKHYGTWYGPYPYGHVTVVDPAYGSGSGGMEYPTLFTCGTRLFAPFGGDRPESVTIHEAGHQFWYGIVGNNEFEHAWIDEGLNTFSTVRTLDAAYPPRKFVRRYLRAPGERRGRGFFPVMFEDVEVPRYLGRLDAYRGAADREVTTTPTYLYYPKTASYITYSKTALWLMTLERHLGWETLRTILSTFFERYSFAHPTPDDFIAVANEVAGQDLGWFFDQVLHDSDTFDYAIESVSSVSSRPRGFVESAGELVYAERESGADELYRTEVVARRIGGAVFPVDVLLVFEDGHEIRERWDGAARHRGIVVERPAKLRHAIVDPERVLMLDLNYTNNSRRLEAGGPLPTVKWTSKWLVWFQDFLSLFAFFG